MGWRISPARASACTESPRALTSSLRLSIDHRAVHVESRKKLEAGQSLLHSSSADGQAPQEASPRICCRVLVGKRRRGASEVECFGISMDLPPRTRCCVENLICMDIFYEALLESSDYHLAPRGSKRYSKRQIRPPCMRRYLCSSHCPFICLWVAVQYLAPRGS